MAIPSFNMYISIILPIKAVYSELGLLFYWTTTQWYQVWIGLLHMAPNIYASLYLIYLLWEARSPLSTDFVHQFPVEYTIQSLRVALWIMTTKKCDIVVTTQLGLDYKALRDEVVHKVRQIVFIDHALCICKVGLHACTDLHADVWNLSEIFPSSFLLIVACCCLLYVL